MRKTIITSMMICATVTTLGVTHESNVKADTKPSGPNIQMLQATDLNFKQRIHILQNQHHLSSVKRTQLASLKTQDANVESQIADIQEQERQAASSVAASSVAAAQSSAAASASSAEAQSSAAKAASESASSAAASSTAASVASSQAASQSSAQKAASESAQASSSAAQSSQASSSADVSSNNNNDNNAISGLNLNQTSGTVNVGALSSYLASHKGTFSADKWAAIIYRESNGQVDAQNSSSGAYGVLQLLGHGEHRGMTLGEQLQMIMPLPASAWAETNY